jgi:hypothetical protein
MMEYSFVSCSPAWVDIKIFQDEDLMIKSTLCLSNVPITECDVPSLVWCNLCHVSSLSQWLIINLQISCARKHNDSL